MEFNKLLGDMDKPIVMKMIDTHQLKTFVKNINMLDVEKPALINHATIFNKVELVNEKCIILASNNRICFVDIPTQEKTNRLHIYRCEDLTQ